MSERFVYESVCVCVCAHMQVYVYRDIVRMSVYLYILPVCEWTCMLLCAS